MRVTMWQISNYWKRPYMKWSHSIIILISFVWKRQNNQLILANDYDSCRRGEYCTVVIVKYKFTTVHGRRAGYTRSSCNASMGMYKNRVKIEMFSCEGISSFSRQIQIIFLSFSTLFLYILTLMKGVGILVTGRSLYPYHTASHVSILRLLLW